jgi:hypothetical protein
MRYILDNFKTQSAGFALSVEFTYEDAKLTVEKKRRFAGGELNRCAVVNEWSAFSVQ